MKQLSNKWSLINTLYQHMTGAVVLSLRKRVEQIADRNDTLCGVKAGVFYYRSTRYPEHRLATPGIPTPSLHEELYVEMDRYLKDREQQSQDSSYSNMYLKTVVMSAKSTTELAAYLPTVLHPILFKWLGGEVGGELPEVGMEELADKLGIPPQATEAFKLQIMRLLLE